MQKSIRRDLSKKIGFLIFCISIVIGIVFYSFSIYYHEKEFKNAIASQTKQLSDTFTIQLWLFDLNTTKELCRLFSESPEVSGLRLLDHKKKVVFEQAPSHKATTVHVNRELRHKGEKLVGYLDIYYTDSSHEEQRKNTFIIVILMVLGNIAGSFIFINILLKRYLSRPLEDLQKDMDLLAKGDFQQSDLVEQKTEIQNIIDTFNKLTISLRERDEEITRRTETLKTEVLERKKAEEALRKSEEKYRSMMESMADAVYICSPDYRVEYMNPAMIKNTGGRNAVGELCHKVLHELDEKCPWCVHDKAQQGENLVTELVSPRDNRTYNVSHSPVHNADGSISKATIYRDVTEIRKMQAQFQQITKMEAIATLAGGVAHEFNNSLMGIMGHIELLKMNLPEDERRNKSLDTMNRAGHRMSRLTDQLLAYAQGGKYQPKDLKLDDFVIETLPILQHELSLAVRVETHFQKDISFVNADNAQMQMVLSAILTNSNEAIEDEGIIRITAENKDADDDFANQHAGLKPGPYVCLTVEDDGRGMDEETREGIFEPFFTTKFQGRGMGMAAAYGIVRNHDGWISVESELGKGTVVQIYLPAIEIEVEKPKKAKAEATAGTGTILMIEDEDVVIEVTQAMLEMLGYRVMVAKTGKDAIHIAETLDGQIDVALLDIKLPDIDGRNLYPLIMKARPDLKVVVFSGYSIDGPAREILDAGAQDFIQKPFSIATLSEKLKEVFEGK